MIKYTVQRNTATEEQLDQAVQQTLEKFSFYFDARDNFENFTIFVANLSDSIAWQSAAGPEIPTFVRYYFAGIMETLLKEKNNND